MTDLRSPQTTTPASTGWRLRMGATVSAEGVRFEVWAPSARAMSVVVDGAEFPMTRGADGQWSAVVASARAGSRYRYRIDGGGAFPDPHSRSQPDGPHGDSEVVDPEAHAWRDGGWRGLTPHGQVIYECHVGVHTPEGTFDALAGDLDTLQTLGVTAIELMPIADFPGARNWGYDGVNLFAPSRNYGGPAALKRLVDAAHERGIGVILDVVYNHFGPDGNYLLQYSPDYLTSRHATPWGDAVNYDGDNCDAVRRYIVDNACYWLNEYHLDGLRLDATFAIIDESPRHILAELTAAARASVSRPVLLIAETHENDTRYLAPVESGGHGFDAVWCDDFHHAVHTLASHEHSGYYADYAGTTQELARVINRGWLFEGQHSPHLGARRGTPSDGVTAQQLVYFIQNHDQVGNRAFGRRLSHLIGAAATKPWSALLLLLPYTPLLFAGQEFASSARFYYFTDHNEELGNAVREGRRHEFGAASGVNEHDIPDPQALETFEAAKLDLRQRRQGVGEQIMRLHERLIALRKEDAVLRRQDRACMRAVAASAQLLLVHMWHGREHRLLVANFGVAVDAAPAAAGVPEDLAARDWRVVASTEERRFGGTDDAPRVGRTMVALPPFSAALLAASEPSPRERAFASLRSLAARVRARRNGG